jgi:hypothetical protein
MALFFVNDGKELMPIAIQLFQDPADDNPVSAKMFPIDIKVLVICLLRFTHAQPAGMER